MTQTVTSVITAIFVCARLLAQAPEAAAKPVRKAVSLRAMGTEITAVRLENTRTRIYRDPFSNRECQLTEKAPGVIWKVVLEGKGIKPEDVTVTDDRGQPFIRTCWSSQGEVYDIDATGKRTGGGPRTEFVAAGPKECKRVTVRFGEGSAEVSIP